MKSKFIHHIITWFIIAVWVLNGLFAKILSIVPRHEQIVSKILSVDYSRILIVMIGVGELFVALWIMSKLKSKWCAWFQILIVMCMNVLEFVLVPELLLFGRVNLLLAILFCVLIYWNEFKFKLNV